MRLNVYSQELILIDPGNPAIELVDQRANTGIHYHAVRMFLHSTDKLHDDPEDDDRSAVTFWLPKSKVNRNRLALLFEDMAKLVRSAPPETGLD